MNHLLLNFFDTLDHCNSEQLVWQSLQDHLADHGFAQVTYGYGRSPGKIHKRSTMPAGWASHYASENYASDDVLLHHCLRSSRPLFTSLELDIRRQDYPNRFKKMLDEVSGYGFRTGMVIPLHLGDRYPPAGINLATELDDRQFAREIEPFWPHVQNATYAAHTRMMSILGAALPEGVKLTPRQTSVYAWLASGLTRKQIADHMNLNINTVDLHLNKGRLKLGARTTHEALAKAVLAGLIEP